MKIMCMHIIFLGYTKSYFISVKKKHMVIKINKLAHCKKFTITCYYEIQMYIYSGKAAEFVKTNSSLWWKYRKVEKTRNKIVIIRGGGEGMDKLFTIFRKIRHIVRIIDEFVRILHHNKLFKKSRYSE